MESRRKYTKQFALTFGSIAIALIVSEFGACALHRGAFPYINIFQADARYGVRLKPNTSTRVRSRDNNITTITTNSLGFRGPEWNVPSSSNDGVLLLGDSQIFGYGVPYENTLAARLEHALQTHIYNVSIPSWGPTESVLAAEEFIPQYKPRFVIFFVNAANDWFETLPNVRRTTARDGWAAAKPAAGSSNSFPFREFFMSRSHLVLAGRQLANYIANPSGPAGEFVRALKRDLSNLRGTKNQFHSRLAAPLHAVVDVCKKEDCTVVAAALPVDVQVDSREWKKYRSAPIDVSGTEVLLEDFIDDAKEANLPSVNLLPILKRAEPGAFLDDDYHLSSKGHFAVAQALAQTLNNNFALNEGTQK